MVAKRIQLRVPATADQLPHVRSTLVSFTDGHWPEAARDRNDVALAVTEACANTVLHAYPDATGELELAARIDRGGLIIRISDDGVGMADSAASSGLGLGLCLLRALADAEIASSAAGTTITLHFAL